jgi:hypothetical protein
MSAIHCQPASQPCQPALFCRLCLPTSTACCWPMASSTHARCAPAGLPGWRHIAGRLSTLQQLPTPTAPMCLPQVHAPAGLPAGEVVQLVHSAEFVDSFCSGTLGGGCLACSSSSFWQHSVAQPRKLAILCTFAGSTTKPTLSCLLADDQRMRRIGFGAVARTQQLIDRTLAEVAGGQCMHLHAGCVPAAARQQHCFGTHASHANPLKGGMRSPLLLQAPSSPLSWRWPMAWPAILPGVRSRSCSLHLSCAKPASPKADASTVPCTCAMLAGTHHAFPAHGSGAQDAAPSALPALYYAADWPLQPS